MNKHFLLLIGVCFLSLIFGCSHNAITYSDGIGFETTANPQTFTFGINFRYGKIFTAVLRENSSVSMTGNGESKDDDISSTSNLKIKIGPQITGYYVDALKEGASAENLNTYTEYSKYACSDK